MTDRRDSQGRFRQPHALESVLDALRDKHAAHAALVRSLHPPSPSSIDTAQAAALERDLRWLTFH
jgi:hypothetical protein